MTTKLYLHAASNAAAGTYPTGEQSSATPSWSATGAATLRTMNTTIGTAQTSLSGTSLANTSLQLPFMGYFVSPPLNGNQSVTAVFRLNVALTQSNTQMNLGQYLTTCLYVWRPSTGAVVGKLLDGPADSIPLNGVAPPSAASTEKVDWGSYNTPATMIMALDGDVLICEVWPALLQGTAAAYTANFYFDGTTENATLNATVSNHAAFLDLDDNLVFKTAAHLAAALSSVCAGTAALTTAIHPKANPAGHVTATSALTTAIRPKANGSSSTTVSAAFTTAIRPKANAADQVTATSSLTTAIRPKAAGSSATTASAVITTAIRLRADGSSASTLSAAFTTAIRPKAAAAGHVSVSAALTTAIALQASAYGVSAATARLTTHDNMVATASVQASATATLTTQIGLLAALAGQANATARLGTQILLKVNASSQSAATARLAAAIVGLRAALLDQTGAAAVLTTRIALKCNPQSHSTGTARLTATGLLSPAEFTASASVLTTVAVVGTVPVHPLVSTTTSAGFSVTVDTA